MLKRFMKISLQKRALILISFELFISVLFVIMTDYFHLQILPLYIILTICVNIFWFVKFLTGLPYMTFRLPYPVV